MLALLCGASVQPAAIAQFRSKLTTPAMTQAGDPPPPMPKADDKPGDKAPPRPTEEAPPPRSVFDPTRPDGGRLSRMGGPKGLGTTPTPSKEDVEEYGRFVQEFIDPRNTLDLVLGRTRLMILKETPTRTQIADENVAALSVVNPKQLTLIGRRVGSTVLTLWFTDPKTNKEKVLSYLVRVIPDPEEKLRLERIYKALEEEINETFPDSAIRIYLVGDKVAVCGQAKDIAEATQILRIVRANTAAQGGQLPVQNVTLNVTPDINGNLPSVRDFLVAGGPNVINLIKVPGEQQVMLKVTVAEVNREAARSVGLNFTITNNQGVQVFANTTGQIATGGSPLSGFSNASGIGQITNNLPVALDNGQINLAIAALRSLNYAKSLAEPNLVALNGQTANFQAGGQFPVPVVANTNGNNFGGVLGGVNFVPFGIQLAFTPYITDRDRVRLNVSAEVSTRDLSTGANVQGTSVPGLNTRNFQTTVELREGQTLAVAGLIQTNSGADSQRVPFIGDLPLIGQLTGLTRLQKAEQELVILITPELVSPLDPKDVSALPGSDLFEPSDCEFYVLGRIEGRRTEDFRSPVRTDIHRIKAYKRAEDQYIFGPAGFNEDPAHP